MDTGDRERANRSPLCVVCGKRFDAGEARIRRGLAAMHLGCVEARRSNDEGGESPRQSRPPHEER